MYQQLVLIGYLGQTPELRYLASGQAVCNVTLATSEKWIAKDGTKHERTEWHRLVVWGKLAETLAESGHKGRLTLATGRLQTRKYVDREEKQQERTEVQTDKVMFLDKAPSQADVQSYGETYTAGVPAGEIPF